MKARILCSIGVDDPCFGELDALIKKGDLAACVAWIKANNRIVLNKDIPPSYSWETDLCTILENEDYILTFDDFIYECVNLYEITK